MTHEFSHNPIKLKYANIKTGEVIKTFVFVGNLPPIVERQLLQVEKQFNKTKKIPNANELKKFYGVSWATKLGLIVTAKGEPETYGIVGGKVNSEGIVLQGGADTDIPDVIKDDVLDFSLDNGIDDILDFSEQKVELSEFEIEEKRGKQLEEKGIITEDDLSILEELDAPKIVDVLKDVEMTEIDKSDLNTIQFIFDQVYPFDNFLEFKKKIYLKLNIPIYRQHIWFKYRGRTYVPSYNVVNHKQDEYINIETLAQYYKNNIIEKPTKSEKKNKVEKNKSNVISNNLGDNIEGIPVNINYYKNKDFLQVYAQDTFNLLGNVYYKYGVTDYYITDLNDLLDTKTIYEKLNKDVYQLEVLYYGFIMLYFPMLTYPVFIDHLRNEKALASVYPDLKPDKYTLQNQIELETNLTNHSLEIFSSFESKSDPYHMIYDKLYSSITESILSIDNHKQDIELLLVLRNLFDVIELNESMPYCKAHILHENRAVTLRKSYFNEPEPKDILPLNSIIIKIKTNADTNENMRLILFKNGNYNIKTEWREENHMDFHSVIKAVSSKINPIIKMINSLGDKVKYHNIQIPEFTDKNAIFTETSLVFYYDDDTTEEKYNILKKILLDYQKAQIISSKESIGLGLEYFFNKGMYKFDASRIEKAISLMNYYDYLSNGVVKQKWSTIFERTRLFQVNNISSKLKFAINGIRNDTEMEIFHMYLIGLLGAYEEHSKKIKISSNETISSKSLKALKNLKMQDPLLYDFKKIYNSNVIYSKICQKPYQPLILSDEEYKHLPADKKKNAVHYWNFTKQKPVWYSCPNVKYPYIKFIIKQHPRDYCIPCCKKKAMNENVNKKKQEIHRICMQEHKFSGEKISLTKGSHYIATYGKNIETGRLSRLPEHTLEPLFFDTYSLEGSIDQECVTADGFYLFGVDQHLTSIKDISYLFSLIHSLGMSMNDFLLDCSQRIKKVPDKFRVILDGNAGLFFSNVKELADTISSLQNDTILPNRLLSLDWNELFISVAYYYYGVNTVIFEDKQKELIDLILPKGLKNVNEMFPTTHKNLVILRKKTRYNPIYLLNTEIFKRTGIVETKLFLNESSLITIIRAIVRGYFDKSNFEKVKSQIDLAVMKQFCNDMSIVIKSYFVNYSNLCYAVLCNFKGTNIYLPVFPSHYSLEKQITLIFTPYVEEYQVDYNILEKIITTYNNWVTEKSKIEGLHLDIFPKIKVERWILVDDKQYDPKNIIGFVNCEMYYYCKPMTRALATSLDDKPFDKTFYSPLEINKLIYSIKNGQKKIEVNKILHHKFQKASYHYYLYHLVLLQFISIFNKETNVPFRKQLLAIIYKTNFDEDMSKLREFITTIKDEEDVHRLKTIIGMFITQHHDRKLLVKDIEETKFNFDRVNLEKLKTLEHKEVLEKLKILGKSSIIVKEPGKSEHSGFIMPNMLTSCEKGTTDYCENKKLMVSPDRYDEILNILAYDIINPTKWKWLFNSIFVEKTIDFFKFIQRSNETITVEFI